MTSAAGLAEARRRVAARSWWADGLEAAMWLAAATGLALMVADGGLLTVTGWDWVYAIGRSLGIVAGVLLMTQLLLASRAPWVERALGHDRAIQRHTRIGKVAITLLLVHLAIMTTVTGVYEDRDPVAQAVQWATGPWFMLFAQIAAAAFLVVLLTSLAAVRLRWPYERWHGVHLLVYVGTAFAIPHQFLEGSTFRDGGAALWFWLALYTVSVGSFAVFRIVRPLARYARLRPRVESVVSLPDGSTTVVVAGNGLERLGARPGQFFLWRFLAPGLRAQAHPYSLSAAPGDRLRITVKPSGDGSRALAGLKPGTPVLIEGPLGVFAHEARSRPALLMIAAGIGVTPVRAMLEEVAEGDDVTVVIRARSRAEAPLLDEVEQLARAKGATLHVITGSRGATWGTAERPASVADFVADPAGVDVFVCGPDAWARSVVADARACGVPAEAVHREEFAW